MCLHTLIDGTHCFTLPGSERFERKKTMAMRFIRWILPLLVVLTIAIVFAVMLVTGAHAAGITTPDVFWHG
jgi:hypothetical protein